MVEKCYIMDNGSHTVKVGYSTVEEPKIIPNCVMKAKSEKKRLFIGDEIDDCRDASGLFYIMPIQKGLIVNWDTQKTIWDYVVGPNGSPANLSESSLIITEPYFNFSCIQDAMAEIFFEDFECHSFIRKSAGDLSEFHYRKTNPTSLGCCVVDVGYSFIQIAPYILGKRQESCLKRIDVGGKLLTNHLKEIISYRQLHVMEETYVMNQVKEDACFVSLDFKNDMLKTKRKYPENDIVRDYVLPDFTNLRRGYVLTLDQPTVNEQQKLRLNNERFTVPEVLFHPSDVGIQQMGVAEALHHSIQNCPEEAQSHLYKNIVVIGGSSKFPGFVDRLYNDLRAMAPNFYDVKIFQPKNPVTYAWHGGQLLSQEPEFSSKLVTREEYEEHGSGICMERFDGSR